ncbi:porin [Pararobbsia alpina]|uniref:Outer membrane porin protein 32 n=1 Tax=Pararobbsia alpina TaxID=621374 RepID=A0A6S7DEP9_9BURK|nr:porin [Pararobbsia alpina]CAB3803368.1 Outer membrane porin protein 32 [Pararobbsia alpina]
MSRTTRRPQCLSNITFALHIVVSAITAFSIAEPAHAQSSLQLVGQVDDWAGVQKLPSKPMAWEDGGGGMSESYFALHGKEDLGSNWSTVFALEAFFQPQNGQSGRFTGDSFFSRDAYFGIDSPYGTLTFGRITTPLFISTILFNPFVDSYTFSPMIFQTYLGQGTYPSYATDQGVIGDSGWNNAVSYATPNFAGLSGTFIYAFGGTPGEAGAHKSSAQLLFSNGPVGATVVYQYVNFNSQPLDLNDPSATSTVPGLRSQKVFQTGLTYDFQVVKLFGQYMRTANAVEGGDYDVNTVQAGVTVPISLGSLMASYVRSTDSGGMQQHRNTWAVGYDYPLSPHTDVYAAFMHDEFNGESPGETAGVGMRAKF